jgi:hypothetical protein
MGGEGGRGPDRQPRYPGGDPHALPTLPSRSAVEGDPDPVSPAIYDELAARYGDPFVDHSEVRR